MKTILKTICLFSCAALLTTTLSAQTNRERPVTLEYKPNNSGNKKSLDINATISKPGTYSIAILFSDIENTSLPRRALYVTKNSKTLVSAKAINPNSNPSYKFRYTTTNGYAPKNVDSAFVYRLPYSIHKTEPVKAAYLRNLSERIYKQSTAKNYSSLQFFLSEGDTVFAARKGTVVNIEDGADPRSHDGKVTYTSIRNTLRIEHPDGTIASYSLFEKGSFMVEEGDVVYPGTPLGICGKQNENGNDYQVRLAVHYPIMNPEYGNSEKEKAFINVYYNPVFATGQGYVKLKHTQKYTATSTKELVQKEMTKKELKRKTNH